MTCGGVGGCCRCKFGLGLFIVAGVSSGIQLLLLITVHVEYDGGMPPIYSYAVGYWVQIFVNIISIYLVVFLLRIASRGFFMDWTPKYCFYFLILICLLNVAGALLFFVPVTKDRMLTYTHNYYLAYGKEAIPPFLNKFQFQYQCCGILNYLDYNDPEILGSENRSEITVTTLLEPTDPNWYLAEFAFNQGIGYGKNFTKSRKIFYFNTTRTCCKFEVYATGNDCGSFIEFGFDKDDHIRSAESKINNLTLGCLEKYLRITHLGHFFQIQWLLGIFRYGALFLAIEYFALIFLFRRTLRELRRHEAEKLMLDFDDPGNSPGIRYRRHFKEAEDANAIVESRTSLFKNFAKSVTSYLKTGQPSRTSLHGGTVAKEPKKPNASAKKKSPKAKAAPESNISESATTLEPSSVATSQTSFKTNATTKEKPSPKSRPPSPAKK